MRTPESANILYTCSDSWSVLQAIQDVSTDDQLIYRVQVRCRELLNGGHEISFLWTPSHVGIVGTEFADIKVKEASDRVQECQFIPYTNWYPLIRKRMWESWQQKWNSERKDLKLIKDTPRQWKQECLSRREEVVINRLRLGHTVSFIVICLKIMLCQFVVFVINCL